MSRVVLPLATLLLAASIAAAPPGSRRTRDFVEAAGHSDAFEIMEATTVLAQSRNPQVRGFAQQMIDAHRDTGARLREAAEQAGLQPPSMLIGSEQAPLLAALQSLRGDDFDRAYMKQQALAHRSALAVEQQYAATGDAPAVRRAAAEAVPVITAHLATAERISAQLGEGS